MRNRVKASAAVIVMVFCLVFVRPSRLRRVIKYSDEYRFGLVSRNLKDSRVLELEIRIVLEIVSEIRFCF